MTNQELIEKVRKYPVLFACGALILALAIALYLRGGNLAEVQAEYDAKAAEGEAILANVTNGANLDNHLKQISEASSSLESRLVRVTDLAKNLQYFYRIEAETGVKVLDLRQLGLEGAEARAPNPLYSPVIYTVSVQGSFPEILMFLSRLETGSHFFRLRSLNCLRAPQGEAGTLVLNLNLTLLGFPS